MNGSPPPTAPALPPPDLDPCAGFSVTVVGVDDGAVLVRLVGELDLFSTPLLSAALTPLAGPEPGTAGVADRGTLELELAALTFLDTWGLTCLTGNRDALTRQGWRVCFTLPRGEVLRFLDLADRAGWLAEDLDSSAGR